jgi:hypothetical protein
MIFFPNYVQEFGQHRTTFGDDNRDVYYIRNRAKEEKLLTYIISNKFVIV